MFLRKENGEYSKLPSRIKLDTTPRCVQRMEKEPIYVPKFCLLPSITRWRAAHAHRCESYCCLQCPYEACVNSKKVTRRDPITFREQKVQVTGECFYIHQAKEVYDANQKKVFTGRMQWSCGSV